MSEPTLERPRAVVEVDSPLVYYIRRNGLIKIGYTTRFAQRMRRLRPDDLLAVEPGNLPLETGRHHQFAAFRVPHSEGREWYAPEPELLKHIARMAHLYEVPELPATPTPRAATQRADEPADEQVIDAEPLPFSGKALALFLRVSTGDVDLDTLSVDELIEVAQVAAASRTLLSHAIRELNRRGETFAQIAERLGVHEATASRWAKPPAEDRRRRRGGDSSGLIS